MQTQELLLRSVLFTSNNKQIRAFLGKTGKCSGYLVFLWISSSALLEFEKKLDFHTF